MSTDLRAEAVGLLQRALKELIDEPPGRLGADTERRRREWAVVKDLYALRSRWLKEGYYEGNAVKDKIEHWYKLLAAVLEPQVG